MNILKGTANLLGKMTKFVVSATSSSTSSIVTGFKEGYTGVNKTPVGPTESPDSAQVNVAEEIKEHMAQQYYTKTP